MHEPLERLQPVGGGGVFIAQDFLKYLNSVNYAVVMVSIGVLMLVLGTEAVALIGKAGRIFWDVDKVPAVAFVALFSYGVRPACNGGQVISAEQKLEVPA